VKFNYYRETDSLYIDLISNTSTDSQEVAPGVVLDFDDAGNLVGIDIDHASKVVDLSRVDFGKFPVDSLTLNGTEPTEA
jgi:uncharacterized protein YuzE